MLDLFLPIYFFLYVLGYFAFFVFNQFKEIHLLAVNNIEGDVNPAIDAKMKQFLPSLYVFGPMFVEGTKTIATDIYKGKDSKLVIDDIDKFAQGLFATKTEEEEKQIKKNFIKSLLKLE